VPDESAGQGAERGAGASEGRRTAEPPDQQPASAHQGQQDEPGSGADDQDFDKERALRTIREQRTNERRLARELDAAKAELKKRQDAEKTEAERLADRVKELEAQVAEREQSLTQSAIESALREAGARHPALLAREVDTGRLERDDRGRFTNLSREVETVRKAYPDLFFARNGSADGGAGGSLGTGGAGGELDMNTRIRQAAGRA
jgi:seryl-tRNA synthetase